MTRRIVCGAITTLMLGCVAATPLPPAPSAPPLPPAVLAAGASPSTPATQPTTAPPAVVADRGPRRSPRLQVAPLLPCPGGRTTLQIRDYDWGAATVWFGPALPPDRASRGKVPICVPGDAVRLGDVTVSADGAFDLPFTVPEKLGSEAVYSDHTYALYIQPGPTDRCGVFTIGLALCEYFAWPIPRASLDPRRFPLPLTAVRNWWAGKEQLTLKLAGDWRAVPRQKTFAPIPRAYTRGTTIHLAMEVMEVEGMGTAADEVTLPLPAPGVYHVLDDYNDRTIGFIDTSRQRGDVGWGPDYWNAGALVGNQGSPSNQAGGLISNL